MARSRRSNSARGSRFWGKISGTTIFTNPSGVTISKNLVQDNNGYIASNVASAKRLQMAGVTNIGGTSSYFTAARFGFSTIRNLVVCSSGTTHANVYAVDVDTSGYSGVTVYAFEKYGTLQQHSSTVQFWAEGT